MKSLARNLLAWILLAVAFLMETFWTLLGLVAITTGAYKIYIPAGWIVGGLALILISEFGFHPPVKRVPNGGENGAL